MTKRILLLGGTGAMGVYLLPELLEQGYLVDITSRREHHERAEVGATYIQGDAQDILFIEKILKTRKYDVVIDFMIYSTQDFRDRHTLLLDNCAHYIYLSSYRVFSDVDSVTETTPRLLDVSEDRVFLGTNDYSLEKARQEDVLRRAKRKNWTIVRPSITYSKERFQLGTHEADTAIWRALRGAPVILPKEMLNKQTTMTWAGDVAKMIAALVLNKDAMGEDFNVVTNEHHSWSDVAGIYRENIGLKLVEVNKEDYIDALGGGHVKYQVDYDRMFNRILDNSKVLRVTGLKQDDFMALPNGLKMELSRFKMNPSFQQIDYVKQAKIDRLTGMISRLAGLTEEERSVYLKARFPYMNGIITRINMRSIREKLRIRTRIKNIFKAVKRKVRVRTRVRGGVASLRYQKQWRQYAKADGAIITLSGYYNYGNILQRYASQKFLKNNGLNFVSYWNEQNHGRTDTDAQLKFTRDFVERYIDSKIYDPKDRFPAYVVGSDQVWRNWGYDDPKRDVGYYFLDFIHDREVKRVAYAASIGQDSLGEAQISEATAKYLQPFAQQFDYVGVREASGVDILKKEWNVDAIEVLDPTMLLSKEEYSQLIDNNTYDLPDVDGTIFTYFILSNKSKRRFVDKVIENKSLKENSIYLENETILPPVEAWLKGIRDADLVVADSFHGIVFSIIFNTPFIVVESGTGGEARITTLLSKFGLSERYITSTQADNYQIDELYNIDWVSVNAKLEMLRKRDGNWFLGALSSDDKV